MNTLLIVLIVLAALVLVYTRGRGSRDRNPLMLLGLALIVIGAIGVFFGRLIQAALSRQREFLADASAVQFTRNPAGLSDALQKIGGAGSKIESAHAGEASHMFFGNGMGKPFLGALATHPPLDERIRAIDPGWDGKFKTAGVSAVEAESSRKAAKPTSSRSPFPTIPGIPGSKSANRGFATNAVLMGAVLPNVGKPTPLHLRYAEELRNSFSEKVQSAAHLASQSGETRPTSIQYHTLKPLVRDCSVVLSALANVGSRKTGEVAKAFRQGVPHLVANSDWLQLLPCEESGLAQLDTALDRFALAAPQIKKKLIEACVQVVGADGLIQEREAELLRAIADTLDCPIPPFVEIAES